MKDNKYSVQVLPEKHFVEIEQAVIKRQTKSVCPHRIVPKHLIWASNISCYKFPLGRVVLHLRWFYRLLNMVLWMKLRIVGTWLVCICNCVAAHGASRYKARVCNIPPPLAGVGGTPGSMEPQQMSPGGVGMTAATEASSTNGGTTGITVTEPDTSTMQKQAAGLSLSFFFYLPEKPTFVIIRVERCTPNCGACIFVFLAVLHTSLALVFIAET
jgi:hypothetical protein